VALFKSGGPFLSTEWRQSSSQAWPERKQSRPHGRSTRLTRLKIFGEFCQDREPHPLVSPTNFFAALARSDLSLLFPSPSSVEVLTLPCITSTGAPLRWLAEGYSSDFMDLLPFPASQTKLHHPFSLTQHGCVPFSGAELWRRCYTRTL
jgi:hypothetical protein